jgi:hypothetical protein
VADVVEVSEAVPEVVWLPGVPAVRMPFELTVHVGSVPPGTGIGVDGANAVVVESASAMIVAPPDGGT